MHLMLAGRLKLAPPVGGAAAKGLPATAFSLELEDGRKLLYGDDKSMGKVYLCPRSGPGRRRAIKSAEKTVYSTS